MAITRHILVFQATAAVLAVLAGYTYGGAGAAWAAAAGGLTGALGTAWFSRQLFAAGPGSTAKQMVRAFYLGAAGKILLTATLFAVAIAGLGLAFLPLLGGYAATLLAYWLSLPFVAHKTTTGK